MSIQFNLISPNVRTPGSQIEFDGSKATSSQLVGQPKRIMVFGQRLAAGGVAALVPTQIQSTPQAIAAFGARSMLAAELAMLRTVNAQVETWACALADGEGAVAAVYTLTFTGPATESATLYLYVGGRQVQVAVTLGDTAADIAANVVTALNAYVDPATGLQLPGTAAADAGVVSFTAANAGALGNWIDIRKNYNNERLPAGVTLAIAVDTAGSGGPAVSAAIAVIGERWYSTFISPYTDATNLTAMEDELEDRWGPTLQIGGITFAASVDTLSDTETLTESRNSKQSVIVGLPLSPTAPWEIAAIVAGVEASEPNPARPRTTMPCPGILAPAIEDQLRQTERNLLLYDGCATLTVDDTGNVAIERLITTYQTNAQNLPDTAYLDLTTMRVLEALRYSTRVFFATNYARYNLANDGDPVAPGQPIITPSSAKAALIALFILWQAAGWTINYAEYVANLQVQRDEDDPNRLDALMPPEIIGQFLVFAAQIQFLL
jgi:phage tail sheath gpL-like